MKFADFVCRQAVQPHLRAFNKEGVIREMAQLLVEANQFSPDNYESIVKALLKREELGSTGIGRGIAVPHTKHQSVDKLVGAVAVSPEGINFDSLDGEKVHLLFMLVSPLDRPSDHLRALENVSRQLRDESFCRFLKAAKTPEEILQLLDEADAHQFGH